MTNPFAKFLQKEEKGEIFHSSAAGRAQNADGIGVASSSSFAERMKIEKNRQIVRGYNDSRVVSQAYTAGSRAKTYSETKQTGTALAKEKGVNYGNRGQNKGTRGTGGSNYRPTSGLRRSGS